MQLQFHNTLTKQKDVFTPLNPGTVNMFVCGPTVYDFSHLGHAKTYVQFDLLARVIRATGYDLTYLQNITDIDDKIIERARERDIDWTDLRSQFEDEYKQDMASLNNVAVSTYARATDHIDDIIRQIQTLIDKNHAYVIDGDGIYFEISTFPDYGKLSGRTEIKENDAQTRIDQSDHKRGWNDFALWKFSKPGEPVWPAPFGEGRPGWHIEDTAITEHYFGPQYDLHGGAIDLIFPHHEAEVTQMESASGKVPFVGYWVHTGFLTINGEKMSKSLGNFYTIREIIEKGYDPMAIRLLMLQTQYRSAMNFTFENLDAAVNRLSNWRAIAALRHQVANTDEASFAAEPILGALADDLNTPEAFRLIEEHFSTIGSADASLLNSNAVTSLIDFIDSVLGLKLAESTPDLSDDLKQLIRAREDAREQKDWAQSDVLRTQIEEAGIFIRDTPHGTLWNYA